MLEWRSVTPSGDPKFLVAGTELSVAVVPNTLHRFVVCEYRTWVEEDGERVPDRSYFLRDAATVSDEDMRNDVRPKIVFRSADLDEVLNFALTAS